MKWIVLSVYILFQIFQVFGSKCRAQFGGRGTCMAQNECVGMRTRSHLLSKCEDTGMICCPNTVPREEPKFPSSCGRTPMYPSNQIVGGKGIPADEYSWIASLQYGAGNTFGVCGGSVINAWYVLTAAHCVVGVDVTRMGGLTGVRLGDFSVEPYCDYGSPNCSSYKHFGIHETKVHENYHKDRALNVHNDIALIRVNRKFHFNDKMHPVCLPFNTPELDFGTVLTVSGWGVTMNVVDREIAKRAVSIPLWNQRDCENTTPTVICAGVISTRMDEKKSSCGGDTGGPLMYNFAPNRMLIEGIVSFSHRSCNENFFPSYFTRVREYRDWITNNMYM